MFMLIVVSSLIAGSLAAPQQSGYNFNTNRNQYNQPPAVQPLQINRQQQQARQQASVPQQQPIYGAQQNRQQAYAAQPRNFVPITSYTNDVSHDGSYSYSFTTGDGQQQQAQGYLKNAGNKDLEAQVVQGSYSYTSPDGTPITVTYIADENGFRAEGAHLPTPPPIPEAIARSLQLIARTQAAQPQAQYNQYQNQQSNYNKFG